MDKRTILALALVAIVVIITPKLFPSSTARPVSTPAAVDSAPVLQPAPAATSGQTAGTPDTTAARAVVSERLTPDSAQRADITPPESTTVLAGSAQYVFTNMGAVPAAVILPNYKALDKTDRSVTLTTGRDPLISYRVLGVSDTVALQNIAFQREQSTTPRGETVLTFSGNADGRPISIRYTTVPDSFLTRVSGTIGADRAGNPPRFLLIDLPTTLKSFEADTLDDINHLAYAIKPKVRSAEGVPFGDLDPGERSIIQGPLSWVAAKSKYFIVGVLAADADSSFAEALTIGGARTSKTATVAHGTVIVRLSNGTFGYELYTGPQEWKRLKALGRDFENSNPYGGWLQGVVQPFATMVMRILLWMRDTLKLNYGWLLVIFGVVVRLVLWPLNHGAMRTSMKMQRLQPELNEIQKKYKSDPQKQQAEMMRVYKEHNMSPFSTFAGCLPLLLPMPVLFALFFVFQNTIEFRGVPFLWLADISLKDPYYIVPLLMGVSMFVLSWVGMRNSPPNPQAKMMLYVFPVMMTFLFASFPSGLNLYYAIQNIAAIPQQWLIANERAKSGGSGSGGGGGKKAA
jgi:YidC/Oxa1 family membrane protein insertase